MPENANGDSGYQGYQEDHNSFDRPDKKPGKGKLTKEEKEYNHALSRFRVRVEQVIEAQHPITNNLTANAANLRRLAAAAAIIYDGKGKQTLRLAGLC